MWVLGDEFTDGAAVCKRLLHMQYSIKCMSQPIDLSDHRHRRQQGNSWWDWRAPLQLPSTSALRLAGELQIGRGQGRWFAPCQDEAAVLEGGAAPHHLHPS